MELLCRGCWNKRDREGEGRRGASTAGVETERQTVKGERGRQFVEELDGEIRVVSIFILVSYDPRREDRISATFVARYVTP